MACKLKKFRKETRYRHLRSDGSRSTAEAERRRSGMPTLSRRQKRLRATLRQQAMLALCALQSATDQIEESPLSCHATVKRLLSYFLREWRKSGKTRSST